MPAFDIDRDAIREPALGDDDFAISAVRIQREHAAAADFENEQSAERGSVAGGTCRSEDLSSVIFSPFIVDRAELRNVLHTR